MQDDGARRGSRIRRFVWVVLALLLVAALLWGSDRITLQGERTIFTVDCAAGSWDGARCTGHLVPGRRYAFRASQARQEVLYWIRGSDAPSGRYTDCTVTDRDNWSCNVVTGGTPSTIAFEMVKGRADSRRQRARAAVPLGAEMEVVADGRRVQRLQASRRTRLRPPRASRTRARAT